MNHQVLSVTFETQAQRHRDGQFSVPAAVCEVLHLGPGDDIRLVIASGLGTLEAIKPLSSGLEIYGPDVAAYVKAGDTIRVTAARAKRKDDAAGTRPGTRVHAPRRIEF